MSAVASAPSGRVYDDFADPRRWVYVALSILFVLIGVSILWAVLFSAHPTVDWAPWMSGNWAAWDWVAGLLLFLLFLWILVWGIRAVVWGLGGNGYRWRHYYRRYARWGLDPAYETARARYARGEISREQFDQISTDLAHRPPGYYP
jgi:putative membrane protein